MAKQCSRAIIIRNDELLTMHRHKFGLEYYTLIGGGVDPGENTEQALRRELREETGLKVGQVRLVYVEEAGDLYGTQYIYLCEYQGGEPKLADDSEEVAISALGQNVYQPEWLKLADLPSTVFRSSSVKEAILAALETGFPDQPQQLTWRPETVA